MAHCATSMQVEHCAHVHRDSRTAHLFTITAGTLPHSKLAAGHHDRYSVTGMILYGTHCSRQLVQKFRSLASIILYAMHTSGKHVQSDSVRLERERERERERESAPVSRLIPSQGLQWWSIY